MHDNPNIKHRPSLIEENPALLVWLLLLVAYLLVVVIAKYAWFVRDAQIVEAIGRTFQRAPSSSEREQFRAYVQQHGLPPLCRVLLNSSELLFVP